MLLEREMIIYQRELPNLLSREGHYVLIHGAEVVDVFPDRDAALEAGWSRYGFGTPFLVKEIKAHEPPVVVPHRALAP